MSENTQKTSVPIKPLKPEAPKAATAAPVNGEAAKEAKPPKAPKPPAAPRESNFKKVYPDTAKITLLVKENPKRKGSKAHDTFACYKDGGTVADFIKAGGYYAALSWDVGHGFVKVETV